MFCGDGDDQIILGFSQVGAESGWRTANTKSIQESADAAGIDLQFSDAQQRQENQISAIRSFIQQGVDVISFSPVVESGWDTVLIEARDAGIPVVLADRAVGSEDDSLFAAADAPMHFTSHGYTFRPFYIADPEPTPLRYHMYVERVEPEVVFGSNGTGVPNDDIRDGDGLTFLDRAWEAAPFRNHGQFVSHIENVTTQWVQDGRFTSQQRQAILVAAARAEDDLRP